LPRSNSLTLVKYTKPIPQTASDSYSNIRTILMQ
jgi:hypothetical protein